MLNKKLTRRNFLGLSALAAIGLILPESSLAVPISHDFWYRNRTLDIKRADNGEGGQFCFFRNGRFDLQAYHQLCWIFRDRKSNNACIPIDVGLLNLLWGIQEWDREEGIINNTYIMNSGYRVAARNERINGAAKDSEHIRGKASDGYFRKMPLSRSIAQARYFNAGGVGTYRTFMHVDSGTEDRRW